MSGDRVRSAPRLLPAAPDQLPRTTRARALAGFRSHWTGALTALLCAWSGIWLAVWLVVLSAFLGGLLGFFEAALGGGTIGGGLGGGVLAVAGGAVSGIAQTLGSTLQALIVDQPLQLAAAVAGGLAVSLAVLVGAAAFEPWLLRLRGCRRLSRREAARVMPMVESAARDLGLVELPQVLSADAGSLRVRAQAGHLVIGRGLLEELGDDDLADHALGAVICHGLFHWGVGDGVGSQLVLACGLPLALVYNAGCWLAQQGNSLIALAGWAILWPAWVMVRLVIRPVTAMGSRRREYAADAAVLATGRGAALHRALSFLGELEPGRSGWDRALADTHPPLELRLEALEPEAGG